MNKQNQSKDRYSITPELVSSWQGYWAYYLSSLDVSDEQVEYWNSLPLQEREMLMVSQSVMGSYESEMKNLRQHETGDKTPKRFKLYLAMWDAWTSSPIYLAREQQRKDEAEQKHQDYMNGTHQCDGCDASKKGYEMSTMSGKHYCIDCFGGPATAPGKTILETIAKYEGK